MKALSVQGGEATSSKMSVRVGGRAPMAYCGEDDVDANTPLAGLEKEASKSANSSKAEEGPGESCRGFGDRAIGGGRRDLGLTISTSLLCPHNPSKVEPVVDSAQRIRLIGLADELVTLSAKVRAKVRTVDVANVC